MCVLTKPLTFGADEVLLQPACCLWAVLGVVESEVIGRDFLCVSLRPLTRDSTDICSCGSQGLEKRISEWIYGTDRGDVKRRWHSLWLPKGCCPGTSQPFVTLSSSKRTHGHRGHGSTLIWVHTRVHVFPTSCGMWVTISNNVASASGVTRQTPGTAQQTAEMSQHTAGDLSSSLKHRTL